MIDCNCHKFFLILPVLVLLSGCANLREKIGISELEWSSYSEARQSTLINSYHTLAKERQAILSPETVSDKHLEITLSGGKVMFPPDFITWHNYNPASFAIYPDSCNEIELTGSDGGNLKTKLGVCYYNKTLYLDSSRYDFSKKLGSVMIRRSPLWSSGFLYKAINSSGYVRFNDVTVNIVQVKNEARNS